MSAAPNKTPSVALGLILILLLWRMIRIIRS